MGPPYYEPATRNGPLRSPINAKRGYDYFQAEAVVVQMEIKRWSLVAVVIGMVNVMLLVEGCLEEERIALLQIKTSFYSPNGLSSQYYSWGKDANCCNWEGVYCSVTTGRVVTLDLIIKRLEDWYLNATLFLPFQELNSLDLSGNNILGCVQNEGFEILSKLDNLEDLYLSSNKFNNSILTSLSALSSLKSLFLSGNRLKGSINIEGGEALLELSNLEVLSLGENRFNNSILQSLKKLDALINLKSVVLDGNKIDKFMFAKDSRGFPNLSSLYLYNMTTNGRSIPFSLLQSLAKFANLRTLVLGWNHFDGTILAQGD
ncbi:unnamed protein product [Dovyalis caffra]|uniref:Leucine-rich repeat-containing N-terminal plant-type domain-containing protein n=1 Tax=Dovyalis caffra TaxID=77055 RepID=A0AAV1RPA7_9ROSI|nr:unnamed protein product [Dovyalis caffra]